MCIDRSALCDQFGHAWACYLTYTACFMCGVRWTPKLDDAATRWSRKDRDSAPAASEAGR